MKKTITYPINDKHFATVEFDGSQVLIYIEESYRIFFNLIAWSKRVSLCVLIELTNDIEYGDTSRPQPTSSYSISDKFAGRYQTLNVRPIYIDRFNLKSEINTLYADYLRSLKLQQNTEKRSDNLINHL